MTLCQFSDPLELKELTLPNPQILIRWPLCPLEWILKCSWWSEVFMIIVHPSILTLITLAATSFDLLTWKQLHSQAINHGYDISKPQFPSITGKSSKVRNRRQTSHIRRPGSSIKQHTVTPCLLKNGHDCLFHLGGFIVWKILYYCLLFYVCLFWSY